MLTGHLIILFCKCEFAASLSVCFVYLYIYAFVGAGVLSDGDCVVKPGCSHHVEPHVHTMLNTPESLLTSIFLYLLFCLCHWNERKKKGSRSVYKFVTWSCLSLNSNLHSGTEQSFLSERFLFIYFKGTSPSQKSFCLHTVKELTLSKLILSKKAGLSPTGRGDHNKNSQIKDFVKNTPVIYFQFTILLHQWG